MNEEPKAAEPAKPIYRHTPAMGEISGMGGGYEDCCQDMLEAGVKWLDEHPNPDLKAKTFKNVYGIIIPDSDECKALEKVMLEAAKGEATGAMMQATMSRVFYIAKNGWEKYCQEVLKKESEELAPDNQAVDGIGTGGIGAAVDAMRVVHKYLLETGPNTIPLPMGSVVRLIASQNDMTPTIWVEKPKNQPRMQTRHFQFFGTGHDIPSNAEFVGSCQAGPFIWHIYEVRP